MSPTTAHENEIKWDRRFLRLASEIATWSKDPGTQVGAVVVRPNRTIASLGYNGFPRGSSDVYTTREQKLLRTVHAELNAIVSAREPLDGCTIYITPLCPCSTCAGAIVQAGIKRVVYQMEIIRPEWEESFAAAYEILRDGGIDPKRYLER
jgi:dCMP deaminase